MPWLRLRRMALSLVAITYVLIVFGASVRVHGAGLACPDWPLCFGEVIPQLNFEIFLEWGHRVLAGGVSVGFAFLFAQLVRWRRHLPSGTLAIAVCAGIALVVQVVLGGLTVLELLAQWTVTSHLLTGNTFCALLFVIALRLGETETVHERSSVAGYVSVVAWFFVLLVPVQVGLGGMVSSSYAGLACGTWPGCNGPEWFPTFSGLIGLQVQHRVAAYTLFAVALLLCAVTRGKGRIGRVALFAFGMVSLQAAIGIANVWTRLAVEVTLLHSAGAAALYLITAWLAYELVLCSRGSAALPASVPAVSSGSK